MNTAPAHILFYLSETRPAGVSFVAHAKTLTFEEQAVLLNSIQKERDVLTRSATILSALMAATIHEEIGHSDKAEHMYATRYQKYFTKMNTFRFVRKHLNKIWMKNREIEASKVEIKIEHM